MRHPVWSEEATMTGNAETLTMQIAQVVPCTEAEGPGKRFAVYSARKRPSIVGHQ